MSILSLLDWGTKRADQIFKWHGKKKKRDNEKKISISVDKRDVAAVKSVVRTIKKDRKARRDSS